MTPEYQVASLWIGGNLSFLEQLCLKSYVDAGHKAILYSYEDITNVPEGVELADANEVLPLTRIMRHERTGSPALHSDLFRCVMLSSLEKTIWVDTDAYCLKPFVPVDGHLHAYEAAHSVASGVLCLPPDSKTLADLSAFCADGSAIPPWLTEQQRADIDALPANDKAVDHSVLPWGTTGPHALTYFLQQSGEIRYSLPPETLYPISFRDRRFMLRSSYESVAPHLKENTVSIHFYGRRARRWLAIKNAGLPLENSLLDTLCKKHEIDAAAAPVPITPVTDDPQAD